MSSLYPKFRNKKNEVTMYALGCGYTQEAETDNIKTTMWHEGGPCIHVRTHDFNKHERIAWDVAETLTEARKLFAQHKKMYHC